MRRLARLLFSGPTRRAAWLLPAVGFGWLVWLGSPPRPVRSFTYMGWPAGQFAWSPDGSRLALEQQNVVEFLSYGPMMIWDVDAGLKLMQADYVDGRAYHGFFEFSVNSQRFVASVGNSGKVRDVIWEIGTGKKLVERPHPDGARPDRRGFVNFIGPSRPYDPWEAERPLGPAGPVLSGQFTADLQWLVVVYVKSPQWWAAVYNVKEQQTKHTVELLGGSPASGVSPDGRKLLATFYRASIPKELPAAPPVKDSATDEPDMLAIYELPTGRLLHRLPVKMLFPSRIDFSPDSAIAFFGGDNQYRAWDMSVDPPQRIDHSASIHKALRNYRNILPIRTVNGRVWVDADANGRLAIREIAAGARVIGQIGLDRDGDKLVEIRASGNRIVATASSPPEKSTFEEVMSLVARYLGVSRPTLDRAMKVRVFDGTDGRLINELRPLPEGYFLGVRPVRQTLWFQSSEPSYATSAKQTITISEWDPTPFPPWWLVAGTVATTAVAVLDFVLTARRRSALAAT